MKKRFVALTDIYRLPDDKQQEIDDVESMIRLLLYANEIDIEGLIATSSFCLKNGGTETEKQVILDIIDAYEAVLPNLRVHDTAYPDADALRRVTRHGIPEFGKRLGKGFGENRFSDNEGVRLIMDTIEKEDERPIWFGLWGGCNTLAQAIWQLWKNRSVEEFDRLIRKVRIYGISDQDRGGIWLRRQFGDRLFYIVSPSNGSGNLALNGMGFLGATWPGMCWDAYSMGQLKGIPEKFAAAETSLATPDWLKANIQGETPYRRIYPTPIAAMEGDTPTYLGLIPNGLNDMEHPDWGSWGGRYERKLPGKDPLFVKKEKYPLWTDTEDTYTGKNGRTVTNNVCTIYRWREAVQNDFAARMAWTDTANYGSAVHPPIVRMNTPLEITVRPGELCTLSAEGSQNPDGGALEFHWFNYKEAGTYTQEIACEPSTGTKTQFTAPAQPCTLHFIVEVCGDGQLAMTRYGRVIVHVGQ